MTILLVGIHIVLSPEEGAAGARERFASFGMHDSNMCPEGGSISVDPATQGARSWLMKS